MGINLHNISFFLNKRKLSCFSYTSQVDLKTKYLGVVDVIIQKQFRLLSHINSSIVYKLTLIPAVYLLQEVTTPCGCVTVIEQTLSSVVPCPPVGCGNTHQRHRHTEDHERQTYLYTVFWFPFLSSTSHCLFGVLIGGISVFVNSRLERHIAFTGLLFDDISNLLR